jgi:hypothetical protein
MSGFNSRKWQEIFSLFKTVQNSSVTHLNSYPVDTEDFPREIKRSGCETDHYLPSNSEVRNGGAVNVFPHIRGVVLNELSRGAIFIFITKNTLENTKKL